MARRGIIGRLPGNFGDEPLARFVEQGADFFTAKIDEVQFDSRYPIATAMLSGSVSIGIRGASVTVNYPAFIANMPFIPVVLCGLKSTASDGRLLCQGYYVPGSGGGLGTFNQNFDEQYFGVKNEAGAIDSRHSQFNSQINSIEFVPAFPDVTMPYVDIDEASADNGVLQRRGFQAVCYSDRVLFFNYFGDPGTITYHIMNIGA